MGHKQLIINQESQESQTLTTPFILGFYLGLTLLLTYPLIRYFSTAFPGDQPDLYKHVWNLWWIKKALLELQTHPFFSNYIFYPLGAPRVFDTSPLVSSLLSIPLQLVFGLVITYNLLLTLSFILSAYGTYLLIHYLTSNSYAALVGGMIFAFCPYRLAHLRGHFDLMFTEGIPFYVLYLFKTVDATSEKSSPTSSKPGSDVSGERSAFLAGLFFLLTALQSGYYAVYLGIFTLTYLVFLLFQNKKKLFTNPNQNALSTSWTRASPLPWKSLGIILLILGIGLSPKLYIIFKAVWTGQVVLTKGWGDIFNKSADLMSFFYPSPHHWLWRESERYVYLITEMFRGSDLEADVFIGYTVLILAGYAIFSQYKINPGVKFWTLVALINFSLALGPFLQIHGYLFRKVYGYPLLYLPYNLIHQIPILGETRYPARFAVMVMLAMAVLAAYTCVHIFSRLPTRKAILVQTFVLVLLILLEYASIPFPLTSSRVPPVYEELRKDPEDFTVMEIPFSWSDERTRWGSSKKDFQYFQTIHEKKILNGHATWVSSGFLDFYESLPVLSTLFKLQTGKVQDLEEADLLQDREKAQKVMDSLHIKYILLHRSTQAFEPIQNYLMKVLKFKKIDIKDEMVIYTLNHEK